MQEECDVQHPLFFILITSTVRRSRLCPSHTSWTRGKWTNVDFTAADLTTIVMRDSRRRRCRLHLFRWTQTFVFQKSLASDQDVETWCMSRTDQRLQSDHTFVLDLDHVVNGSAQATVREIQRTHGSCVVCCTSRVSHMLRHLASHRVMVTSPVPNVPSETQTSSSSSRVGESASRKRAAEPPADDLDGYRRMQTW